jgi:hypothetical protein
MLKVIYAPADQAVAQRIINDLRQAGYEVGEGAPAHGDGVIVLLSEDPALQSALIRVLDLGLRLVIVMAQPVPVPKLINHLQVVDLADGYDFAVLRQQVDVEMSPETRRPMRVLTPTIQRSNRNAGIVVGIAALIMFAVGLYAVGVLGIQAPLKEFNTEYTMDAMTRDIMVKPYMATYAQFLPQSTDDAVNYPATLRAIPTAYRPLVAMTATAVVTTPTKEPYGSGEGF